MTYLVLNDVVRNSSSNIEGEKLFILLQAALEKKQKTILCVGNQDSLSSSFLNSSIGLYLDNYGLKKFKNNISFKGNKNQFSRLSRYISLYSEAHL